jgi:flagellar hook-associated protein 1
MSDLLGLLHLGSAGLAAQHSGAAVAANNAANVNTVGYSRQRVDLRSQLAAPEVGGVRAGSPTRIADGLVASRQRGAAGSLGYSRAYAPAMADLESRLINGTPLETRLTNMFTGLQRVAASPTDPLARDVVVQSAEDVATGVRHMAAEITASRNDADARIRDNASNASTLTREIASLNKAIKASNDPVLRDRRDVAAGKLAELVGGTGRIDPDGMMRWVLPDGAALVDGERAASVVATPDPVTGRSTVEIVDGTSRRDVTASLGGGSIGADLHFRDVAAAEAATRLDQFAYDLATQMNGVHAANAGLDGVSGRNLFTAPGAVAGAAAAFAVDPAIAADSRLLATAAPGAGPGSNSGAIALIALRDAAVSTGGHTLLESAIDVVGVVGLSAAEAEAAAERDEAVSESLAGLRDSISGVDLDEEMSKLVQFQHASEAMTKFLSTIDGMLSDLLGRL